MLGSLGGAQGGLKRGVLGVCGICGAAVKVDKWRLVLMDGNRKRRGRLCAHRKEHTNYE